MKVLSILLTLSLSSSLLAVPNKVALLSPALVDIFFYLGLEHKIVAYTEPISKSQVLKLKKAKKLGFYNSPILEKIISSRPELVIASYNGTPPSIFYKLNRLGIKTILYKANSLNDIALFIKKMAELFAITLRKDFPSLDKLCIKEKTKYIGNILISSNPFFIAGKKTFISDAVECAGFQNTNTGRYKKISLENLLKQTEYTLVILSKASQKKNLSRLLKRKKIIIFVNEKMFRPSIQIFDAITDLKKKLNGK